VLEGIDDPRALSHDQFCSSLKYFATMGKTMMFVWTSETQIYFAADESRWIRCPSSALPIHEKLGAKQVMLNALFKLTFILYFF